MGEDGIKTIVEVLEWWVCPHMDNEILRFFNSMCWTTFLCLFAKVFHKVFHILSQFEKNEL